jgi:hypothetical protein
VDPHGYLLAGWRIFPRAGEALNFQGLQRGWVRSRNPTPEGRRRRLAAVRGPSARQPCQPLKASQLTVTQTPDPRDARRGVTFCKRVVPLVILPVIPPGATRPHRGHWLDHPPNVSCRDSTGQYAVDGPLLSCNPLRATRDRGSSACQSASCHQMEYLVPAPQWSPRSGGRGRRVARLDHPVDHPDDPTGPVWSRLDRRGIQREQARSDWSRPDRRRAPGYGSGGWGFQSLAVRQNRKSRCYGEGSSRRSILAGSSPAVMRVASMREGRGAGSDQRARS